MKEYQVTPLAGPFVAARRNPGAGQTIVLTERQAAHELRLGTIVLPSRSARVRRKSPEKDEQP